MRTRVGKDESSIGREHTSGNDGLHPVDGRSTEAVSWGIPTSEGTRSVFTFGGYNDPGTAPFTEAPGPFTLNNSPDMFAPISASDSSDVLILGGESTECKDGVCPVPWMTNTFLAEDRNSNFPGENTIPQRPKVQPDLVNHPPHYVDGGIECIEAIEAQLTPEEYRGYLKGNNVKYLWRERHKGGTESLKKAGWYLDRLIQFDEATQKG